MKRLCVFAVFYAVSMHAAMADDITIKLNIIDQQGFANLPGAVDQCVAGLQLRGDAQMCKAIAAFATEFGAKVKAAAPTGGISGASPGASMVTVPAEPAPAK